MWNLKNLRTTGLVSMALLATMIAGAGSAHAQDVQAIDAAAAPPTAQFGFAVRSRYVSVPAWFLGLFTKENTTLSTLGHFGAEFLHRKGNRDIAVGVSWQNMSPPDGNWLGAGKQGYKDVDYVQFKDLQMWGIDATFIWHNNFNEYIGVHYGAGLGLGILTGKILRTSAGTGETTDIDCVTKPGDETKCFPKLKTGPIPGCPSGPCSESALQGTESNQARDSAGAPNRFPETSVPGAIPILNFLAGVDVRSPDVPGLEFRLPEIGFYNAFYIGMGVNYLF
jgi:hypothetical protein